MNGQAASETLARLRAMGERVTPARRAVIRALEEADGHLDADSVSIKVAQDEPGVHRATVYRTLQSLSELGLVGHTHVPGAATIYHLTTLAHEHAHMQCVRCHKVFDLPVEWIVPLAEQVQDATGFAIQPEHAALLGVCADCQVSGGDTSP